MVTRHEIYAGQFLLSGLTHVATLSGWTVNGECLELTLPIGPVRYVKIETLESPSWVSWREIEIYQAVDHFGYFADAFSWVDGGTFTAETHSAGANFTFIAAGTYDPQDVRQYILERLSAAHDLGCKAFVDLSATLFQENGNLPDNWEDRWNALSDALDASALADTVVAFYPHDEPYWFIYMQREKKVPGTPTADELRAHLNTVATAMRKRYPNNIPIRRSPRS